jgi:hypothetical protein
MKIGIACRYEHQSRPARSIVYGDRLLELLRNTLPAREVVRLGDGSSDSPFVPMRIGEWFTLAHAETAVAPMFISIGGRKIARWGSGAGPLQDYITDVTDYPELAARTVGALDYQDTVRELKRHYDTADAVAGIDTELPIYTRKALRVARFDDRTLAIWSRRILHGEADCSGCPELASSIAALFIAEAHRSESQAVFAISLMLLDLVETATTYGAGGAKTYTWGSMLMHHLEGQVDPHPIPGRGRGLQLLGKHPMAGAGTAAGGRGMFSWLTDNPTRDRAVSIMSVWLAHYMAKYNSQHRGTNFTFFIVSDERAGAARQAVLSKADEGLRDNLRRAVAHRCRELTLLIGGTTVYYENIAGAQV